MGKIANIFAMAIDIFAEDEKSIKFGSCYFDNVYDDTVPAILCVSRKSLLISRVWVDVYFKLFLLLVSWCSSWTYFDEVKQMQSLILVIYYCKYFNFFKYLFIFLAFCQIDHVSSFDGTIYTQDLTPGNEQYCGPGETIHFDNGTVIETIKCSGTLK